MPSFTALWSNPLLGSAILNSSRENKAEFAIKSQDKLEANPPIGAPYSALITASRSAVDLFLSFKNGVSKNMQMAATQRLDALEPLIVSTGKVLEAKIVTEFETDPAVITEFFPNGRTELSRAKRGDMQGILERLLDRATAHQAELGAGWVTRLTTLLGQWTTNMAIQSGAVSQLESARNQIEDAWETLSWAFFDLVIQLLIDNPRNPNISQVYFDFSVFTRRQSSNTDNQGLLLALAMDINFSPLINAPFTIHDMEGRLMDSGTTNGEGKLRSRPLPIGFYRLSVTQVGYRESKKEIQVFDDNDPLHEIFLERD